VLPSRRGGTHLNQTAALGIIRNAARRVDLAVKDSPRWLRHAHAPHVPERGAPSHVVQATHDRASVATTGQHLHARPTDSSARYLAV
jgi:integrase/recombinase XerD